MRGAGLGAAVLQFAPAVAILSLTLLKSPCWAMRNAALQLYSKTETHLVSLQYNRLYSAWYINLHGED